MAIAQNNTTPLETSQNGSIPQISAIIHDRDKPNEIHRKMNFILRFVLADSASLIDDKTEYQKRLASLNFEFPEFQSDLKRILTDDNYMDQVVQNLQDTSTKFYLHDEFYRKTIDEDVSKVYSNLEKVIAERPKSKRMATRYDPLIENYETQVAMIKSAIATQHMRLYALAERLSFLYDLQTAELNTSQSTPELSNDGNIRAQNDQTQPIQDSAACTLQQQKPQPVFFFDYCDPATINKKWRFINEYRWMKNEAISKNLSKYNSKLLDLKKHFPEYETEIQRLNKDFKYRNGVIAEFNSHSFARFVSDDTYKILIERLVNEAHQKFIEIESHLESKKSYSSSYDELIQNSREPIRAFLRNKDKAIAYSAYDFFHDVNQFAILVNQRNDEIFKRLKSENDKRQEDCCFFDDYEYDDDF